MGASASNIFYYRVIDMHPLARGLNLLCILGLSLAALGEIAADNCELYDGWRPALARC